MKIVYTIAELQKELHVQKQKARKIGFIPTMGALHDGHASLIRKSKRNKDYTVSSIFVNPTQFNDPNDLKKYPRTLDKDLDLLESLHCNLVFIPEVSEIYPDNLSLKVNVNFGHLFEVLEGAFRPGHFNGVVTVVKRLLDLVEPHYLYMGQKDFQQSTIIAHMIRELKLKTDLVICKTKREKSGLAMSSRNVRLEPQIRKDAAVIYKTLKAIKKYRNEKTIPSLIEYGLNRLNNKPFRVEYLSIVDGYDLRLVNDIKQHNFVVACVAIWANEIRLIDNIILKKEA